MAQSKAGNDPVITDGEQQILERLARLETRVLQLGKAMGELAAADRRRAEHHDGLLHGIDQGVRALNALIDQHRPILDRAAALMDPAAKLRSAWPARGRKATAAPVAGKDSKR